MQPGFIQHVACWMQHKETGDVRCIDAAWPARHHTIINIAAQCGYKTMRNGPDNLDGQGFLLDGKYLTRLEAAEHAVRVGQIQALKWPPYLYSEDLW